MRLIRELFLSLSCGAMMLALSASSAVGADLEITELMYNPISANDTAWEWIEIRNTTASPIDLNGAYAGRVGDDEALFEAVSNLDAATTVVPANGVAVLYDAFLGNGNPANFDDQKFRDAWGLAGTVPLIAVNGGFPALANGGTAFGFWANASAYAVDVADFGDGPEVSGLTNTLFDLNYTSGNNFPGGANNGTSIRWSGNGDYRQGSGWAVSELAEPGVVTSVAVTVPGATNSVSDIGSPGSVPAGPAASGLLITEIMYNPRSPEGSTGVWEWVEIYNNTGAEINFGSTNYVLDDDDGNAIGSPNLNSGIIPNGQTAVLFNDDDLDFLDMQAAWDPGGANGTTFIGVMDWPGFANGDDVVALWKTDTPANFDIYVADRVADTWDNALVAVEYDDNPGDLEDPWPQDDGDGSIYLSDLSADPNVGANWLLSAFGDGVSTNAAAISGTVTIHPGGDIGSPGRFTTSTVVDVDLDDDGDVDGADFLLIQQTNPSLISDWQAQYPVSGSLAAAAVPEPASIALFGLALVYIPFARRK